jgi:hypothetical protein
MNPWASLSLWQGDGVRRELFNFNSGPDELYGSLYAAMEPERDLRLVICPGWGFDFFQMNDLMHALALGIARLGGAAVLFHPPGHGDSRGSIEDLTIDRNVAAALDAAGEAGRRLGGDAWDFGGIRIGAAVAALAADSAGGRLLPLIDPVLDLATHFEAITRRAKRLSLGRTDVLSLFGHPLPKRAMAELPGRSPKQVVAAFGGLAATLHFAGDVVEDGLGERVEDVAVPGAFSNPAKLQEQETLADAALQWIRSSTAARMAS